MPEPSSANSTRHLATPVLQRPRLIILANHGKEHVSAVLGKFRPWLEQRAEILAEPDIRELDRRTAHELPEADLGLILGGDGTLLSQARALIDIDLPLLGINFGKVGFLAEYSIDSVKQHWDAIMSGRCLMSARMMIDVKVFPAGYPEWGGNGNPIFDDAPPKPRAQHAAGGEAREAEDAGRGSLPAPLFHAVAMNDAVITAGPPFRMIDIELAIEPSISRTSATMFTGDGVVVATPSGSTAYNLSAGGPIVAPGIDGLCIAAIAPQSLAFRPIVAHAASDTWLYLRSANAGTTLVLDGQESFNLGIDQQVRIARHPRTIKLVHNPDLNYWKMLAHKMHWAARPRRD
ncbi:MAG: hypothetical protein GVY24_01305 [Planctomycetes bacterium]|nr:hypothetical protein [Planctomycetota bacterium]